MERTSVFSYAATACLVLAVLAVGAGFYRNYGGSPVQPEDDYAVTVMSEKTEADASEGEKQAENDTNQSLDAVSYTHLAKTVAKFCGTGLIFR